MELRPLPESPEELADFRMRMEEIFVWGQQQSWIMLGRSAHIFVTSDGLGFTSPPTGFEPVEIHVNPRVLLEDDGTRFLQGLILHELGHHEAHFTAEGYQEVFRECRQLGLARLLNIIGDEHLERRLRSRDAEWGEALDALAAFAFVGEPVRLVVEDYARLLHTDSDAARDALLEGHGPGTVVAWEWGLRLEGAGSEELDGPAFIRKLLDAVERGTRFDLRATRSRLEREVTKVRARPGGPVDLVLGHPTFQLDAVGTENTARLHVTEALRRLPGEDRDAYLERLRSTLAPALVVFPGVERFVRELEVVRESRWFWNKQASMLHNMLRKYSFAGAFLPARAMTEKELSRRLGWSVRETPGHVARDLVDRWRPVPFEMRHAPLVVRLSWAEVLRAPGTPSFSRFFLSLRLGLGRSAVGEDPVAEAALRAIPRRLKEKGMGDLGAIVTEVARILGPDAHDHPERVRRREAAAAEGGEGAGPGAAEGDVGRDGGGRGSLERTLSRSLDETRGELHRRLEGEPPESVADAVRQAADAARRRVREWLDRRGVPEAQRTLEYPGARNPSTARSQGVVRLKGRPGERGGRSMPGAPGFDHLNIAETCGFEAIEEVAGLPEDPEDYASIVDHIRPQIRALRRYLQTLGLRDEEVSAQVRGHRFDVTRARRLAVLGDPHVLVGRQTRNAPDLFMGVAVDSSGSMMLEGRMERAAAFAVLLLEAARGLEGIDVHVVGFTDAEIFDAGGPGDTAVASLRPDGGNNDAAGLLHAARLALATGRERRLLLMISDGFPTECSLDSLKHLVTVLERDHRTPSAQVAVDPLDEERVAFPEYTDLAGGDLPGATAAFGRMVQRLVRKHFRI